MKLKDEEDEYPLNKAIPEELPHPSFWPFITAFGALFFFWGFIASWIVSLIGLISMAISITGWIGELSDE